MDGAIALTTLKIEKDAAVILETKSGGCVQGCVQIEGTGGLCTLVDGVVEHHAVGFVVTTNANALYCASNASLALVGKVVGS